MLSLANNTPERPGDETKNSKDQDLAESTDDLYPGIRDPEDFIFVWQQAVLPFLATFANSWFGDEYTIGLRRGKSPGMGTINIMTTNEVPGMQKTLVIQHTRDILPRTFHKSTEFNFHTGSVCRLGAGKVDQSTRLDPICEPKNPYVFQQPAMGDSVGLALNQGDNHSTSTLGSCILLGETPYWLLSCHPFEKALSHPQVRLLDLAIEHPSPDDRSLCHTAGHKFDYDLGHNFEIGKLTQISGPDKSTTRISRSPYWKLVGLEAPHVIMDWAICTAKSAQINIVRLPASKDYPVQTVHSTRNMNEESAGATVYSVGRTSGLGHGQLGLSPELVSTKVTGARTKTMEWFVEEPYPYDNEEGWIESGIGISGDSGAAILDRETNHLYGHLWGRNEYRAGRSTPRVTYFTPIDDIFDDIEEKFSGTIRPRLPQLSEASTPLPSTPMCQQCRLLDPVWIETLSALPEAETPGMDITREERNHYNRMTPMRDLTRSVEMTPQEDEILTPEDIRSPELQRERMILFKHTGLSCQSSYDDLSKREKDMAYTGVLEICDAGMAASFSCDLLHVELDEVGVMPSGVGTEVKRRIGVGEVNGESMRAKKHKVA